MKAQRVSREVFLEFTPAFNYDGPGEWTAQLRPKANGGYTVNGSMIAAHSVPNISVYSAGGYISTTVGRGPTREGAIADLKRKLVDKKIKDAQDAWISKMKTTETVEVEFDND